MVSFFQSFQRPGRAQLSMSVTARHHDGICRCWACSARACVQRQLLLAVVQERASARVSPRTAMRPSPDRAITFLILFIWCMSTTFATLRRRAHAHRVTPFHPVSSDVMKTSVTPAEIDCRRRRRLQQVRHAAEAPDARRTVQVAHPLRRRARRLSGP